MSVSEPLAYEADGLAMTGQLQKPEGAAPKGWVLVFPEALGLGEHAIERARRLTEEGYVALACDLYGDGRFYETPADMAAAFGELRGDAGRVYARAQGAYDALRRLPGVDWRRVSAIGHCFGGTMVLELARRGTPLAAGVGFHCGLGPVGGAPALAVSAPVLVCLGADDPSIPPEQRLAFEDEMRSAGASWRMSLYGGVAHSFTNPAADRLGRPEFARYDAAAERASWSEMLAFMAGRRAA